LTTERTDELLDAKRLGFEGEFISPLYITLGRDLPEVSKLTNPSSRKIILVKGHQSDTGRALNALQVISALSSNLAEFEILVYSAPVPVQIQVDLIRNKNKINIKTITRVSNSEMLELFKRARISISLAVSDGLPAVLVEAMSFGAFPIQSTNSVGSEFLANHRNGFLVDPWDLDAIRDAILKAVSDDNLVDEAVVLNHRLLQEKYSLKEGKSKLRQLYL
jgi:glycosyltransferase involved in cell wall biosynthesis